MKKKITQILLLVFGIPILSALELVPTLELLSSYLQKDSELKNLTLELTKARLNQESTELDKGFSIKLSSGDMTFRFGDNNSFTVSPGLNATIPQASNLGLNVNTSFSVSEGSPSFDSASAKLSVDIISSSSANREISLLKSERQLLEAQRKLTSAAIDKEKAFYKSLSSLLSSISSLISKQNSIIDDYNSLEKIKLQGYAENSPSYIKAQLKVLSSERELESAIHSLISDYKLFYLDCGQEITIPQDIDFMELVPSDLPAVEALDITSFPKEKYSQIESAEWSQKINEMTRQASTKLTLTADGGYSYRNSRGSASNTVDAGLSASYEGLGLSAGLSFPIASETSSPSLTLGLSYSPLTSKKNAISEELTQISIEQEEMKIASAYQSYDSAIEEKLLKLEDIKWNMQTNQTNCQMYEDVEKEMLDYYKRGLISEKDYTSAKINLLQAQIKNFMNQIDLIIYNAEVKAMFVE